VFADGSWIPTEPDPWPSEARFWQPFRILNETLTVDWKHNTARRTAPPRAKSDWPEVLGPEPPSDYTVGPISVHHGDLMRVLRFAHWDIFGMPRSAPTAATAKPAPSPESASSEPSVSPAPAVDSRAAPPKTLAQSLAEEFGEDDISTTTLLERLVADMQRNDQISPSAKKFKAHFAAAIVKRVGALRKEDPELKIRLVSAAYLENHLEKWGFWPR
jgi:hypothetical protein